MFPVGGCDVSSTAVKLVSIRDRRRSGSESKKAVSIVNPVLYVIVHLVDDVADNGGRWERRVNPTFVQRL